MTFWIYNVGMGVPISEKRILTERKSLPLEELAHTARIHHTGKESFTRILATSSENQTTKKKPPQLDSLKAYQEQEAAPDNQRIKSVSEIMSSPVITLPADSTFNQAWEKFIQLRYRHFPIVDGQERLVGIISDRDLLAAAAKNQLKTIKMQAIETLMIRHVLTASANSSILNVCRVMFHQHIGALPITDENAKVTGIVSRSDILKTIVEFGPLELWV